MTQNRKSFCHNELDHVDFTYRNMVDDLKSAIVEPRFEGEGRYRHAVKKV